MPGFEHGFKRGFLTFIVAFLVTLIVRAFLEAMDLGYLASVISILIFLISLVSIIEISGNMYYWGILYSVGFLVGLIFLLYAFSSMLNPIELFAYILITIIAISIKISHKLGYK